MKQDIAFYIRVINCIALILALIAIITILVELRDTQQDILTYIQQYEIAE